MATVTTIQLDEPTVFLDLNKKEGVAADFERSELKLNSLKYKHFRAVLQYPEADQMHHLMLAMTGLSENDLGELSPATAAEISGLVFESMKEYLKLGQKIIKNIENR
jgi:hypothetical protein